MSDIERFVTIWGGGGMMPADNGIYVRYGDHRTEVERLTLERDQAQAEVKNLNARMTDAIVCIRALTASVQKANEAKAHAEAAAAAEEAETDRVMSERDAAQAEVERLTARQTDMETHITGLTAELHRTRADGIELRWVEGEVEQLTAQRDAAQAEVERLKEQVGALTVAVEQADEMKAHAEAAAAMEEAETDRVMAERDAAQAEVERLRANSQAILDSSRPTDEDIWREAFMRCVSEYVTGEKRVIIADAMLAEYRKRWPR